MKTNKESQNIEITTIDQAISGSVEHRDQFIKQTKNLPNEEREMLIRGLVAELDELDEHASTIHIYMDKLQKQIRGREIIVTTGALALFDLIEHFLEVNRFDLFDAAGLIIFGPLLGLLLKRYITDKYGPSGMQGTDTMKHIRIKEIIDALEQKNKG